MNCFYHADATATAYCRDCGRALCDLCQRREHGTVFCPEHAPFSASGAGPDAAAYPPPYPGQMPLGDSPVNTSPALAFALGFIPGVGAIYNGQYLKGLIHAVIFGLLSSILSNGNSRMEPLFGIVMAAFIAYMPFEAYHTAKRRRAGMPVDEWSSFAPVGIASQVGGPGQVGSGPAITRRNSFVGPIVLITLGVLFLLDTMNVIEISDIVRFWPLILIGIGAYRLYASGVIGTSRNSDYQTRSGLDTRRD